MTTPQKAGAQTPTSVMRPGGCRKGHRRGGSKDGNVESRDDPVADEPFKVTPVRIEDEGPGDVSDQRRADDAQAESPMTPARRVAQPGMSSTRVKAVHCPSIVAGAISPHGQRDIVLSVAWVNGTRQKC